jgi:hypothetical protein
VEDEVPIEAIQIDDILEKQVPAFAKGITV